MPDSSANSTTTRPIRRISSWKAFGIFCLVSFLILFGVVFIPWDVSAPNDADLQFKPPTIDADKNAFTGFEAAGKLQVVKFSATTTGTYRDWRKLPSRIGCPSEEWNPAFADEVLTANVAVFPELEKGLALNRCVGPQATNYSMRVPWLFQYRDLTLLLNLESKRAQLSGDPVAAIRAASQSWRLGQLVTSDANMMCTWHTGIECQQLALARFEEIVADEKTPESALHELLQQFNHWDQQGVVRAYVPCVQEEYRVAKTYFENLVKDPKMSGETVLLCRLSHIPYCFKPNLTLRTMVSKCRAHIKNVDRIYVECDFDYPGRPSIDSKKESVLDFLQKGYGVKEIIQPNSVGRQLFVYLLFSLGDIDMCKKHSLYAYVDALRLKIALRLYEQKHGQLPDELNALVPEYLKEISRDPYDGKAFRYSKQEKKVWAVGGDLIDNGGKQGFNDFRDISGRDLVMPLGIREMKPTPPPDSGPSASGTK